MKQSAALVLSGGAARGLAHIGVIEELEKQGFEIKSIAGNSMGAYIAAVYGLGKLNEYKDWILNLENKDIFKLIDFTFSSQGLIKGDKILNKMKSFIPDKNIENLTIPYAAVAADLTNMKEVVFTEGSIYDAVRSSISIPTIFTPFKTENSVMVDGGIVNPIPLNRVKRTEDDILIASYVNADITYERIKTSKGKNNIGYKQKIKIFKKNLNKIIPKKNENRLNYFTLLNKSTSLLTHSLSIMNIEKYKPDMLINISRYSAGTFDFFKAEELIEAGRRAAKESINNYKNNLK
ncbi:MAG: patatin-like phospholipase family protein [Bacteroidales bacterium]|nr:patatin-like phospholipase family protein [Bacteroidales bacterium]